MRQLPPVVVDFINRKYGRQRVVVATAPYWSTIRLSAPFATGIIPAGGSRQAFSYGIGTDMTLAGRVGLANLSDTNLQKPGETRKNADIFIAGVAAYFAQDQAAAAGSDPAFFGGVMRECSVEITTVAGRTDPLATLEMLPSGGGLTGVAQSRSLRPDQNNAGIEDGGAGASIGFAGNGNPMAGNFFMLDAPILWTGQAGVDSNFRLIVNNARAITAVPGAARVAAPGGAAGPVEVFTAPTIDPHVDIRFRLAVYEISLPSVNQ